MTETSAPRLPVSQGQLDRSRPISGVLAPLLPGGVLRAGSVVACEGRAAVTLALAVASAPSLAGSWTAVVGLPTIGLGAVVEAGVVPERLVRVDAPSGVWGDVLAAAIDGFDLVLVGPAVRGVTSSVARRVVARAMQRGTVLVTIDTTVLGADVRLVATDVEWHGIGAGFGVARGRCAQVEATGRRLPGLRRALLWLPGADGAVRTLEAPPVASRPDPRSAWRSAG